MPRRQRQEPRQYPTTPDGRYFVVDGQLWRRANPALGPRQRALLVSALMRARRDVARALRARDVEAEREARARVHRAKLALGERGAPWWTDGAPDFNRRRVEHSPYADWYSITHDPPESVNPSTD